MSAEQPVSAEQPMSAEQPTNAEQPVEHAAPRDEGRLPARVSTIVWGVLLLGFCAYSGTVALGFAVPNPVAWLTTALILGGIALVAAGIAASARRR